MLCSRGRQGDRETGRQGEGETGRGGDREMILAGEYGIEIYNLNAQQPAFIDLYLLASEFV
jgi:hypothetical protein